MDRLTEMMYAVVAEAQNIVSALKRIGLETIVIEGTQRTLDGRALEYKAVLASKSDVLRVYVRLSPRPCMVSIVLRPTGLEYDEELLEELGAEVEEDAEELRIRVKAESEDTLTHVLSKVLPVLVELTEGGPQHQ